MILNDIPEIGAALNTEKSNKIKLLHKLLFNSDGDRGNRKRIRLFSGFEFTQSDPEFKTKVDHAISTFSLIELISIANILKIDIDGTESELTERIISFLVDLDCLQKFINENKDISDNESEEIPNSSAALCDQSSNDIVDNCNQSSTDINDIFKKCSMHNSQQIYYKNHINYSDIEHLLPKYTGAKTENIERWLVKFESFSSSFQLSEIQKFIFAERALGGLALLFIKSETGIRSYEQLKTSLLAEFRNEINSADVHDLLRNRVIKDSESIFEYFLIMRELSSRGNIDDSALIRYVINGINDTPQNKCILYDCKNLSDFKQKLKVYDEIRQHTNISVPSKSTVDNVTSKYSNFEKTAPKYGNFDKPKHKSYSDNSVRSNFNNSPFTTQKSKVCYNCGAKDHLSRFCTHKSKGFKCFRCNNFGHKASDNKCPSNSSKQINHLIPTKKSHDMHIVAKVSNVLIDALIDTGSPATLLRYDIYSKMDLPEFSPVNLSFSGLGNNNTKPLGSLPVQIAIDDDIFTATVYIMDKNNMSLPLILGTDIINQGTLICNQDGISFTKNPPEKLFVYSINVIEDPIDLSHLNSQLRNEISSLVNSYQPSKTRTTNLKMNIILKDDVPVCQRARRLSFAEKDLVQAQIEQWLKEGIIQESCSDYASPIVLVKKKDGSTRLCIDYRKLNKKIIKDNYPLPLIDDILDQLRNAKIFTTIDLKNGFFHVDIDPHSTKYTAFITHNGHFEFLKAPFGLNLSPAAFNRYLATVFRDLLADGTLILYMDDFIIPSETEEEGLVKLKRVLHTASEYGLNINLKKCQFLVRTVEFLGHIIENNTISPSPSKIKAVKNFPEPTNVKHLQSFLGLAGYFRKYISGYATIAKPLSDLLRSNSEFCFGPEQRLAFSTLKELLTNKPVLHLFVPGSEIEVHTDASKFGFGSVLLQKSTDCQFHPILFMSKKTSPQQEKLHSYELEVLAVIEALKKFRVYLHGVKFKIVTDCEAFQKTMDKTELSAKIARWALFLQDFDYTIVHRPAKQMQHVDALSRYPIMHITYNAITQKIVASQSTDNFIAITKKAMSHSPVTDFILKNDVLYKIDQDRELLVVPQAMQNQIIQEAHLQGHFATQKTVDIIQKDYYIPNLTKLVQTFISNCVPCILASRKSGKPECFLHPIPKGDTPLDTYHIDFLGPLPSTNKNYHYLFTVIDAFTKFLWIYPVKSTSARDAITKLTLQQTVFGNPRRIISDKGSAFTSTDFKTFCDEQNIEHVTITTGVPRGNGQVERFHKTLIPVLTKLSLNDPTKWYKHVPSVQKIINSVASNTTKYSPFELMIGIKMKHKDDLRIKELLDQEHLQSIIQDKHALRQIAKSNILHHQQQNKRIYDKRRKPPIPYQVNDLVAIKRTQYGPGLKLRIKYFGPYKVKLVNGNDRYDVEKVGHHEGPNTTSTSADFMKPWSTN